MTAVTDQDILQQIADPVLVQAIQRSVARALDMCDLKVRCVGVSAVPLSDQGRVTAMVGIYGKISGFITVNFSEHLAVKAVEGLLQDSFPQFSSQVIDGVGELTNIIAGGIKSALSTTRWAFSNITVPSVIVGTGYQIAYARGLDFVATQFEYTGDEIFLLSERFVNVSLSMLPL